MTRHYPRTLRIRAFLKRNSQLLTVLGALIVFLTYEVKENMREHAKSVAESVEGTRRAFEYLREQHDLSVRINGLTSDVRRLSGGNPKLLVRESPFGIPNASSISLDASAEEVRAIEGDNDFLYAGLVSLFKAVPDRKNSQAARNVYDELLKIRKTEIGAPSILYPLEFKVSTDLTNITEDALAKADAYAEARKRQYDLYDLLSNLLFGIGWAISLLPKLFGLNSTNSNEGVA